MTVKELIERLESENEDAEVRIAIQPAWPLQSSIRGALGSSELDAGYEGEEPEGEQDTSHLAGAEEVVWIVEGSQIRDMPYAPRDVFEGAYR